jgi:hypothetical protein
MLYNGEHFGKKVDAIEKSLYNSFTEVPPTPHPVHGDFLLDDSGYYLLDDDGDYLSVPVLS